MNIFALDRNQRRCARWHVDKHVIKMLLEYCQLLYTAHWALFYPALLECESSQALSRAHKKLSIPEYMMNAPLCDTSKQPSYRPCHIHHPCASWTRQSSGNYRWLSQLGLEVASEYTYRFGKIHSCQKHSEWLSSHLPPTIPQLPHLSYAIAMDEEYRTFSEDPIECYRNYYNTNKKERGLIHYTKRRVPYWLTE